ncbi:MAG: DUF72 domain-containing protein [Gemmatimonadota bacterium]
MRDAAAATGDGAVAARRKLGTLRVGTSGYHYPDWREVFYPSALPAREWFRYYAERFDTVEINHTFYRLPAAATFDAWRERAPEGFLYALKFSRFGSHLKRLREPEATIGRFLEVARRLGPSLGPILVQLPPRWKADPERLATFLDPAPRDVRWAVEVRDRSWLGCQVYDVLRDRGAALCIHDMIAHHPSVLTSDWLYFRFHGRNYAGSYSTRSLEAYARKIRAHLSEGRDVYAYFNNDVGGRAVLDAAELRRRVLEAGSP